MRWFEIWGAATHNSCAVMATVESPAGTAVVVQLPRRLGYRVAVDTPGRSVFADSPSLAEARAFAQEWADTA